MPLQANTRLGPYEVLALIGAGGMGEVYRARDTRLDRDVAIKILPPAVADHPTRRARFAREARSISQLSHPHICTVHDVGEADGITFLVMEYLEGEPLEKRLRLGPVPGETAIEWAAQIAGALDAAHRRGIVHRDLKPANIMVTETGVKLLDFGLAKLVEPEDEPGRPTESITSEQRIVGTLHYMSPEQLEGREVDARTDVFAFGVTLYEMVTGRKAFTGTSAASVSAAILTSDPPSVSSSAAGGSGVPPGLDHVIRRALAKNPDERWQTARDLILELRWLKDGGHGTAARPSPARRPWWLAGAAGVAALSLVAAVLGWRIGLRQRDPDRRQPIVFTIDAPPGTTLGAGWTMRVSPDGRKIAFPTVAENGDTMLWWRSLDATEAHPLAGTNGGSNPFWSPDSTSIGYYGGRNSELRRVSIKGGTPALITPVVSRLGGATAAAFWARDDTIVFGQPGGLFRVRASGGTPVLVTPQGAMPRELPDGRMVYLVQRFEPDRGVKILGPDLDAPQTVRDVESNVVFSSGHLVFRKEQSLVARPFDGRSTFGFTGPPVTLAEGIAYNDANLRAAFDVSDDTLIYTLDNPWKLTWRDREGRPSGSIGLVGRDLNPAVAPDGSGRVSVDRSDPRTNRSHLWIIDPDGRQTPMTNGAIERFPTWWPDGTSIVYTYMDGDSRELRRKTVTGAGKEEVLFRQSYAVRPLDVSRDGRFLVYRPTGRPEGDDLWALPLTGNDRTPLRITHTPHEPETTGRLSPDGRWITYASIAGNQQNIWMQEFPSAANKQRISPNGGIDPSWRADGKELYYVAPDGTLMATAVTTGPPLAFGTPAPLFKFGDGQMSVPLHVYSASPDGRKFLVLERSPQRPPITVVVNWRSLVR